MLKKAPNIDVHVKETCSRSGGYLFTVILNVIFLI